jgi:hypothetical protein
MEISLGGTYEGVAILAGRVIDEKGAPVADAWVALDGSTARTGPDGAFTLDADDPGETGVLWAAAAGRRPARLERAAASNAAPGAWPEPLELVVGGAPAVIRGRVVDAAGEPVPNAKLRLVDPTDFGSMPIDGMSANILIGSHLESLLAGRRFTYGDVDADDLGRFVLRGLVERAYRVEAIDKRTLVHASASFLAGPDAEGEEVELRLPEAAPPQRVAGRVVHVDGTPAEGARVVLEARRAAEENGTQWTEGAETHADEDGAFAFESGGAATHLWIEGSDPGSGEYVPLAGLDLEDLELVLARTCHAQVVLTDPTEATSVRFLDAEGRVLNPIRFHGNLAWGQDRLELADGRSEAVLLSELAVWLALDRDGEEIRRVPIALVPETLNTLRP